jgi:hypothetical protein
MVDGWLGAHASGADRWGRRGPLNRAQKDAEHLHMLFEDLALKLSV